MNIRNWRGQEATEFVLITVLVFFSALLVVFIFGNKISSFFTSQSSAILASKHASSIINPNSGQKYNPEVEASLPPIQTLSPTEATGASNQAATSVTTTIPETTENPDGSLSFTASGQNVTISSQMKDLSNAVFQTTGSNGSKNLVKEVAYMIEKHKAEYPNANVPIEVVFGDGQRVNGKDQNGNQCSDYVGTAIANSFVVKVGKDMVITQNDQQCVTYGTMCNYKGVYRIEGTVDNNNLLADSKVKATGTNVDLQAAKYSGTIDLTNGIKITNSRFQTQSMPPGYSSPYTITYDWNINFNSINNSFNI